MYDPSYGTTIPQEVTWNGRSHRVSEIASYRARRFGGIVVHQYMVTDGNLDFYLSFDSQTLSWRLDEIDTVVN